MTNSPEPRNSSPNFLSRLLQLCRQPTTIAIGVTSVTLVIVGGVGFRIFMTQTLPHWLEKTLSDALKRQVILGKVESYSLTSLKMGVTSIPETSVYPQQLTIKSIDAQFNPLSLLIQGRLPIKINLKNIDVYAKQDLQGNWFNIKVEKIKLPVDLDLSFDIQDADISLQPKGKTKIFTVELEGKGRYIEFKTPPLTAGSNNQKIQYDVTVASLKNQVTLKGNTFLPTGKTQVEVGIQKLALPEIVALIPNFPLQFNTGQFKANINAQIPSFKTIDNTQGQGNIQIANLAAKTNNLKYPIKISSDLSLQNTKLIFNKFQLNWSDIQANAQGNVDWKKGLDLKINVKPFDIDKLIKSFSLSSPISLQGNLTTQLQIRGKFSNPVITGILKNNQVLFLDKIILKEFNTTFQANWQAFTIKSLKIRPAVGGEIAGKAVIKTDIKKYINEPKSFDWTKIPLKFTFNANLPTQKLINVYYQLPAKTRLGNLTAKGELTGTFKTHQALLKWQLPNTSIASVNNISGTGELLAFNQNLIVRNTELKTREGKISINGTGNIKQNRWQTVLIANSFNLSNFVNTNNLISLDRGTISLLGTFDNLDLTKLNGVANLLLKVNESKIAFNSELQKGNFFGSAIIYQLVLNPFLPNLPVPVKVAQTEANFSGSIAQLLNYNYNPLNATANLQLLVDNQPISIRTSLTEGLVKANVISQKLDISSLIPNLTIPVIINKSKVNISGQLITFLSLINLQNQQINNNYQDIKLTADTQLNIANNIIDATTQLNNNQWQTNILAFNIPNTTFCPPIEISCPPIDAKIILSGNLTPLIRGNSIIPIQAKAVLIQVEGQNLKANGDIILANLGTRPDANVNLNVEYSSNLKSLLPLDEFISQIPIQRELLLSKSTITGKTYFKGRLLGNNLLTASNPLENVLLAGNAELTNLSINNRSFEPRLTGILNIAVQKQIVLNLKGKEDIFAFTLERCSQSSCLLPYLPNSFEVKQSYNSQVPAQIKGKRQGQILSAELQNFPLELLRITPVRNLGLPSIVTGIVDADLQFNLFTLAGIGNLNVQKPGIGNIQAESFDTQLVYNKGLTQLKGTTLQIGRNRYEVDGSFDINTQALQGRLQINEGNIQDLIEVANLGNLGNLPNKFLEQPSPKTTATNLQPYSIGSANSPISEQLNQFQTSEQIIRQQAARIESGLVAPLLNVQGKYQADIILAGTLKNPQINLQFQGKKWEWFPKGQYLNLVEPLGLVIQESQTIPIEKFELLGSLENGQIKINYQSQLGAAKIALNGNLVQQNTKWGFQDSTFTVNNLSLDLLRYFFKPPIDISGEINAQGILKGNFLNPEIMTNFAFNEGALNGRPLNIPLEGNLSYAKGRFKVNTIDSSAIKIYASVPYPVEPKKNDRIELDIKLGTKALELIDLFTQGQLNWVGGEGEINLTANGRLSLAEEFKIYDLNSNGQITLNNATLQTPNLDRPLIFNGQLAFNNEYLEVKQLEGNILDTQVTITGILPLFEPLTNNQNPFKITLVNGQIASKGRYRGEVSTNLMITGSAISPIIGGKINIAEGQIFLGSFQQENPIVSPAYQQWAGKITPRPTIIKPPQLDNLEVVLDNIELIQDKRLPQYKFNISGQLNLAGNLTSLGSVKPTGKISLDRGKVYILTTDIFLSNQHDNTLTFSPDKGLFNPFLDVQLKTFLWDTAIIANTNNEIPDDITKSGRRKSVELTVAIEGQAEQLYTVTETVEQACEFEGDSQNPRLINPTIVPELSQQLTNCLRVASFVNTESDLRILRSPVITISSSPPLTQNEINVLFNRQLSNLSTPLQEQNSSQLVEIGIPQMAVTVVPFLQQEIFEFNEWTAEWGKSTFGLERLQIIPLVQTGYQLKDGTLVRISYDYFLDEVTVRYELRW